MNLVFQTPHNSVVQVRLLDKSAERRVGFSVYEKIASWGNGFEFDFSMFGYHVVAITYCRHCTCSEKGNCKHSVKSTRRTG